VFSFLRYTPAFRLIAQQAAADKAAAAGAAVTEAAAEGPMGAVTVANLGAKTAVHEILHVFGLGHCTYAMCLMNGSGHLLEDSAITHTVRMSVPALCVDGGGVGGS
jgi:hypothetical protein